MKNKLHILIAAVALLLCTAMLLGGCNTVSDEERNAMQQAEKLEQAYGGDDSVTNMGENAPVVTLTPGEKPYRSKGNWLSIADQQVKYDLKVTTFNVGQWYHGVTNLDIYGAQEKVHEGILPEFVIGAYNRWMENFPEYDADLICAQELNPVFMIDSKKGITLTVEEVLDDYFKEIHTFEGHSQNGILPMWMGMLVPNSSEIQLKNVTGGQIMVELPMYTRAYMKGYITVNGHDIAVYNIHTTNNSAEGDYLTQAFHELIEMASKEEYAIIMGDTNAVNGPHEFDVMKAAGFSMANCGEFGIFDTYEYREVDAIDNIFVTSNIEIVYAECEKSMVSGSDHYPVSAYLVIKDEPHTNGNPHTAGDDGYMEGWYQP